MNIKRIIVDELPESCFFGNCIFPNYVETQISDWWECTITGNRIEGVKIKRERPSWCPLEPEQDQVCEWKGKPDEHFEYKSPHEPLHYLTDFPNAVNGGVYDTKISTYYHVCGKRIKYE